MRGYSDPPPLQIRIPLDLQYKIIKNMPPPPHLEIFFLIRAYIL